MPASFEIAQLAWKTQVLDPKLVSTVQVDVPD